MRPWNIGALGLGFRFCIALLIWMFVVGSVDEFAVLFGDNPAVAVAGLDGVMARLTDMKAVRADDLIAD
jgi:hypothetical protein